jgi:hypothetical protein
MNTYRRILRGADRTHAYWVALGEEKCIGQQFHTLRDFCEKRALSLSPHGHSVVSEGAFYQVFMFADEAHAEIFRAEFGGERMHPSEKGRGTKWSQWRKGSYRPKAKGPYDFS